MNAVFGSDTQESADREIELVFGEGSKIMEMAMEEDDLSIKGSAGIQRTLCIIKSEDETVRADIIERIICRGITISKREELVIGVEALKRLFPKIVDDEIFNDFVEFYSKTSVLVLGLQGENVVKIWNEIAGPRNPEEAKERFPCR
jgi:nucleoside diphosphate kinase